MKSQGLPLLVFPGDQAPITQQISSQIAAAIRARRLRPGDELESLSELAERLLVSRTTVKRAYRRLLVGGLCTWGRDWKLRVAQRRAERDRRETLPTRDELARARALQRRLLPPPRISGPGYSIASRHRPAGFISGDLHEVLQHRDGSIGLVVADVAGKGVGAGLIAMLVKAMLLTQPQELDVEIALRRLNRRLWSQLGPREFVALVYARFHPASGRLTMANAGMPDACLLPIGRKPAELSVPGPRLPLGVRPEAPYQSMSATLSPRDRLLLYSDGLPEARVAGADPLGYQNFLNHLAQAHAAAGNLSLDQWMTALLARVAWATGVRGGSPHLSAGRSADDWTALLLEAER